MTLVLPGEGRASDGGELLPDAEALARIGEQPTRFASKEGRSPARGLTPSP